MEIPIPSKRGWGVSHISKMTSLGFSSGEDWMGRGCIMFHGSYLATPHSTFCVREEPSRYGKPKLLDQLRQALRARHYSHNTARVYALWVKRFIMFHGVRHPAEMGEKEINSFLTHLAVEKKVSASTQNQALSALLFLYRHVIGREVGDLGNVIRSRKPSHLPVVSNWPKWHIDLSVSTTKGVRLIS